MIILYLKDGLYIESELCFETFLGEETVTSDHGIGPEHIVTLTQAASHLLMARWRTHGDQLLRLMFT